MKKSTCISAAVMGLLVVSLAWGHPHFRKTVTAELEGGTEAKVSYVTVPANMDHLKDVKMGAFNAASGNLTLSADTQVGTTKVAAGQYAIGAIKNGDNDWTLALYPGQIGRGEAPDMAKVIKLDSLFSRDHGTSGHATLDIAPGWGKLEGKAVLTWQFGDYFLAGAIS